jgi:hypothetical protein
MKKAGALFIVVLFFLMSENGNSLCRVALRAAEGNAQMPGSGAEWQAMQKAWAEVNKREACVFAVYSFAAVSVFLSGAVVAAWFWKLLPGKWACLGMAIFFIGGSARWYTWTKELHSYEILHAAGSFFAGSVAVLLLAIFSRWLDRSARRCFSYCRDKLKERGRDSH